jgi:ATP-binding cassette subfamily B protein
MSAAFQEDEALGKAYDAACSRGSGYVAPYRLQVLATILVTIPSFGLELAPAWIIKNGLDRLDPDAAAARGELRQRAARSAARDLAARVAGRTLPARDAHQTRRLQFANGVLMSLTGQAAMRDLRRDVFAHLQSLHLGFLRPLSGRPARHARDQRRREHRRDVLVRDRRAGDRRRQDDRLRGRAVPGRRASRAGVVPGGADPAALRDLVPPRHSRRLPQGARPHRAHQRDDPGDGDRHEGRQLFTREARNLRDFDAMNAEHRDAWDDSIRYDAALFAAVEVAGGVSVAVIVGYGAGFATAGTLYVFIDWMRRFFLPLRDLSPSTR